MPARVEDAGRYQYLLNGVPMDIEETWQRREQAAGAWSISSQRVAGAVVIAVEASVVAGLVSECVVTWQDDSATVRADYSVLADRVGVVRRRSGCDSQSLDIPLRPDAPVPLLSPLMRVFAGPLIAQLLDRGGRGDVLVPAIGDPGSTHTLLTPLLGERSARVLKDNVSLVSNGVSHHCRLCEYSGDQYGPGTEFWLGEDNLLLRYRWRQSPQRQWDVWLRRGEGGQQ